MFVEVRTHNIPMSVPLERDTHERFSKGLVNFVSQIEDVIVRIEDVNGPRGGVDKVCRATVFLERGGTLSAEGRGETITQAVAAAVTRSRGQMRRRARKVERPWQQRVA